MSLFLVGLLLVISKAEICGVIRSRAIAMTVAAGDRWNFVVNTTGIAFSVDGRMCSVKMELGMGKRGP